MGDLKTMTNAELEKELRGVVRPLFKDVTHTYSMNSFCPNCMETRIVHVPKGQLLVDWEQESECPKCGCTPRQFMNRKL